VTTLGPGKGLSPAVSTIRLIQGYYLASPGLFLLGWLWGAEVRATFLPDVQTRFLYYLFLSVLGLLTHFRPSTAPFVALGESVLNLFLIFAWILLPIYGLAEGELEMGMVGVPYTAMEVLVNGGLAGTFFLVGFYQAQARILGGAPVRRWRK